MTSSQMRLRDDEHIYIDPEDAQYLADCSIWVPNPTIYDNPRAHRVTSNPYDNPKMMHFANANTPNPGPNLAVHGNMPRKMMLSDPSLKKIRIGSDSDLRKPSSPGNYSNYSAKSGGSGISMKGRRDSRGESHA